jgi:peptidoglycan/xylan/chitin deacetylase (PgdA/CDA1 family)
VTAALAVTLDVDGEAGLPEGGAGHGHRLSSRSERAYGITRGLPRMLALLAAAGARATCFFPGAVAERHPAAVRAVLDAGHELALHGYAHRRLDAMGAAQQRADLDRGVAALRAAGGAQPLGYRAPAWELTPVTLALLGRHGFLYDSSLMGDDRPYVLAAGCEALVELPVHWTLDDAPHYAAGGTADTLAAIWRAELDAAVAESRLLTVTLHPEISGRPHRLAVLAELLEHARARQCPVTTLAPVARALADLGHELGDRDAEGSGEPDHRREPRVADAPLEP